MDRTAERELMKEMESLLAEGTTAMADQVRHEPVTAYTDPARLATERELFFTGTYPLVVAMSQELPNPGDFTTSQVANLPVLTVRGKDGQVRSLVNICRHRGNNVCLEESGNRRAFACEYHAWSYDLAGKLRSTVDREGFAELPRDDYGLVELPTEERNGLIWMLPKPGATLDVPGHLGAELDQEIADLKLDEMVLYGRKVFEQPFNWKLGSDTFYEVFHLSYLHKKTVGPFFVGNVSAFRDYGRHFRFAAVRKTFTEMLTAPEQERTVYPHTSLVHLLFPNTTLTWQMDHIEMWRFYPSLTRDDACTVEGVMLIDKPPKTPGAERHWKNNWDILLATVQEEDFTTMSRVQQNMASGAMPELAIGRNEVALQHFHKVLDAELERHRPDVLR